MFSNILYINLDRRSDRNANVISQLQDINYNGAVERIPAIDAKNMDFTIVPRTVVTVKGIETATSKNIPVFTYLTKGGIGCALSHKRAFEQVLYGKDDYVLILEDDIWFDTNFTNKIMDIMHKVPDYDILWLGYHNKTNAKTIGNFDVPNTLYGLFGYIINKKAASVLLDIFPITWQIDTEIPKVFNKLKVFALKENDRIIFSEPSQIAVTFGTDIQTREGFEDTYDMQEHKKSMFSTEEFVVMLLALVMIYFLFKSCTKK